VIEYKVKKVKSYLKNK